MENNVFYKSTYLIQGKKSASHVAV